jgi:hypothetical protein
MLESGSSGSVRGVLSNEHPYREPGSKADLEGMSASGAKRPFICIQHPVTETE